MPETPQRTSYSELVRAVGRRERVAMLDVRRILDAAAAEIVERVGKGGRVVVGGLGTFGAGERSGVRTMTFRRGGGRGGGAPTGGAG